MVPPPPSPIPRLCRECRAAVNSFASENEVSAAQNRFSCEEIALKDADSQLETGNRV